MFFCRATVGFSLPNDMKFGQQQQTLLNQILYYLVKKSVQLLSKKVYSVIDSVHVLVHINQCTYHKYKELKEGHTYMQNA